MNDKAGKGREGIILELGRKEQRDLGVSAFTFINNFKRYKRGEGRKVATECIYLIV